MYIVYRSCACKPDIALGIIALEGTFTREKMLRMFGKIETRSALDQSDRRFPYTTVHGFFLYDDYKLDKKG